MDSRNKLRIVFGDVTVGIHGEDFHYIFSKQTGGMESLVKAGKEWLYRTPYPTFWRATTDNDRGNGFPLRSGMWLGADQFRKCIGFQLSVDGEAVENHNAPEIMCTAIRNMYRRRCSHILMKPSQFLRLQWM